jgi:hypothetical protein
MTPRMRRTIPRAPRPASGWTMSLDSWEAETSAGSGCQFLARTHRDGS